MKPKFSIKQLIIGFSILITLIPISSIIYFSYKYGERSIQDFIFDHLTENVSNIKNSLRVFLSVGKDTNETLSNLIKAETITLRNRSNLGQSLLIHLKSDPDLMSIEYADERKETLGVAREIFGRDYAIGNSGLSSNFEYQLSEVDISGKPGEIFWTVKDYDPREMSWYKTVKESKRPQWTPIYLWPIGEFGLDFVSPITRSGNFEGVVDVSIRLNTLKRFIENAKHYPNSQIFLLEKNGLIVAGTDVKTISTTQEGLNERISASESNNPVLRDISSFLTETYSDLSKIISSSVHPVSLNGKSYTLIVDNYNDNMGIDWVVVKAVLNDDLMGEIVANTKTEIKIMLLILVVSLAGAIVLSNYITHPLTKLIKYSESLGNEDLKAAVKLHRNDEIGVLANKLEEMTLKLNNNIDELKKLDKLKDDFLSTTTHELKTPLVPIKSQSQMLLKGDYGKLTLAQVEAIEMIYRNEENLTMLTNEILDISKMRSNKFALKLESIDLKILIDQVVQNMSGSAKQKEITFSIKIDKKLPKIIVDATRIRQVLSNLVGNAIKFTPEKGSIRIVVSRYKNMVYVVVSDTGIGISPENIGKLFTPFFQIDSTISRKYRGTGLGLAISKGIIDAHGGEIWAKSKGLDKGSEFGFSLPISRLAT